MNSNNTSNNIITVKLPINNIISSYNQQNKPFIYETKLNDTTDRDIHYLFLNENDVDSNDINIPSVKKYNKIRDYTDDNDSENNSSDVKKTKIQEIYDLIKKNKDLTKDQLFIVSSEYERIYKKYNILSLAIMIISAISTFIEAFRLLLANHLKYINIDDEIFNLIINIISLVIGTIITIISSIIRFRNYRESMEKLKNDQKTLSKYRLLYDKEMELIKHLELKNNFDEDAYNVFYEKIKDYNKEIKEMNIYEDIRNSDLIRVNIEKANFESKLNKIYKNKEYKDEMTNKAIEIKKLRYNVKYDKAISKYNKK
jgi:hypothetical protein